MLRPILKSGLRDQIDEENRKVAIEPYQKSSRCETRRESTVFGTSRTSTIPRVGRPPQGDRTAGDLRAEVFTTEFICTPFHNLVEVDFTSAR